MNNSGKSKFGITTIGPNGINLGVDQKQDGAEMLQNQELNGTMSRQIQMNTYLIL